MKLAKQRVPFYTAPRIVAHTITDVDGKVLYDLEHKGGGYWDVPAGNDPMMMPRNEEVFLRMTWRQERRWNRRTA